MASVWVNGNLVNYAEGVVNGSADPLTFIAPYKASPGIVPALTFADLNVDTSVVQDVSGLWTFALTVGGWSTATVSVTFTFSSVYAGSIYYGVALYRAGDVLAWVSSFPTMYFVPPGGGSLTVAVELDFSDCAYHP